MKLSRLCSGALAITLFVSAAVSSSRQLLAEEGRISVSVVDASGHPMPSRGWVDAAGERCFRPVAPPTVTPYAKDRSFSCDGKFTMLVPEGMATVHVEKGKEYRPVDVDVEIVAGETLRKVVRLDRWIDMPGRGWYSADLHVHLGHDDPRVLKQLALADDVHLIPAFTFWLRGRGESWNSEWPEAGFTEPMVIDETHLVTRNNIEIERIDRNAAAGATIGATFLFNLQQPVTARRYGEHFPTDAELCRVARHHSPAAVFDSDKPSWAETVVGAALGMLDTVQVCHNHYHRLTTSLGGYGMIGPLSAGESNAAAGDGLFHRTNALYYRFLNCGFRLGVSGGSAIGVKAMPTGHHRVYAQIEGPLTAAKMWESIKAGRTFATTGPILTLTANGNQIGSTISIDSGRQLDSERPIDSRRAGQVKVRTSVEAIEDIESLEIVHDGRIVASRLLSTESNESPGPRVKAELEFEFTPHRSGWIASRALYRAPDGMLRQAHTSPIYLAVDDLPTASAADADYMLRWIDRLTEIATSDPDRFPDRETRDAVLATYAQAQIRYQQIVDNAQQHWGQQHWGQQRRSR